MYMLADNFMQSNIQMNFGDRIDVCQKEVSALLQISFCTHCNAAMLMVPQFCETQIRDLKPSGCQNDDNQMSATSVSVCVCVRACMRACVLVTEDNCSVEQELVKRRSTLLLKYIRRDVQFELEALYAVQLIVHKHGHPYGLYCSQHIQLQHRLSVALKTLLHLCLLDVS